MRLNHFLCEFSKVFDEATYPQVVSRPDAFHETNGMYKPGEPEKWARAGTTVFGGMMVLSAIFAQSLIMVNFPYQIASP